MHLAYPSFAVEMYLDETGLSGFYGINGFLRNGTTATGGGALYHQWIVAGIFKTVIVFHLRSIEHLRAYFPGAYIPYISPTPWLLIVALDDVITPADPAIEAFSLAEGPKKLVTVPGGHFDVYGPAFAETSAAAQDWFVQHLR